MYLLKAKGKHKTCNTLYFYIQFIRYSVYITNTKAERNRIRNRDFSIFMQREFTI